MRVGSILVAVMCALLPPAAAGGADGAAAPASQQPVLDGLAALQPDSRASDPQHYAGVTRVMAIFADGADDPAFTAQLDILRARHDAFAALDFVLLVDTDPDGDGPLRAALRPRGFGIVFLNSDGQLTARRRSVSEARALLRQISQMR